MKKLGLMMLLGAAVCSAQAESALQIDSTNMVGLTCFSSSLEQLPIGVTYGDYATTNLEMNITNLLWTGNLEEDDTLYIYDYSQGKYLSMVLNKDKVWEADAVDGGTPIDVDKDVFKYGRGAWLVRRDIASREDKNVYMFGQVPVGQITVKIEPGTGALATSTLISSPISELLDLNGGAIDWSAVALKGDVLRVPQEDGTMKGYSWNVGQKKWYVLSGGQIVTEGLIVPRGKGFWYSRAAKNTTGATLTWNLGNL